MSDRKLGTGCPPARLQNDTQTKALGFVATRRICESSGLWPLGLERARARPTWIALGLEAGTLFQDARRTCSGDGRSQIQEPVCQDSPCPEHTRFPHA